MSELLRHDRAGDGSPLLLLHGWCCRRQDWSFATSLLAGSYDLVAVDLPGHGESPRGSAPVTVESSADAVAATLRELALGTVTVVGHSMGAAVALELVRRHPDIGVDGVVALESLHHSTVYPKQPEELVAAAVGWYRGDFDGVVATAVEALCTARTPAAVKTQVVAEMTATPADVAIPAIESLLRWDRDAALAETDVPVHVLAAAELLDPVACEQLQPRCTVSTLPAGGHFFFREAPREAAAALRDALQKLRSAEVPAS